MIARPLAVVSLALAIAAAPCAFDAADIASPQSGGAPWSAADTASLKADLDILLAGAHTLRGAHVGVLVEDPDGHVLYARNADDAFQPASTFKLLVGSVALDRLGPAYRFVTTLVHAPVDTPGGSADALILRGGGDPLLGATDLSAAADAARAAGVPSPVQMLLDESHVAPGERFAPGWSIDDLDELSTDAAVIDGLPFEQNSVRVTFTPGLAVGSPAIVSLPPPLSPLSVDACRPGPTALTFSVRARTVAAGAPSTADTEAGRCGEIVAFGDVPLGATEDVDTAVGLPELLAWQTFAAALRQRGIEVAPPLVASGPVAGVVADAPVATAGPAVTVWQHAGEPLAQLLADMWLPSDNFIAEQLLREIDAAANAHPGTAAGAAALEREWLRGIGVDPVTLTIADGSGLSQYNRVTPRALVAILLHDWHGPNRDIVLAALPIAGVRGTQRNQMRGTPAAGRAYVKDGTMRHIRGLAGYVASQSHGTVIFALSIDDWMGTDDELAAFRAAFCSRLVGASPVGHVAHDGAPDRSPT